MQHHVERFALPARICWKTLGPDLLGPRASHHDDVMPAVWKIIIEFSKARDIRFFKEEESVSLGVEENI